MKKSFVLNMPVKNIYKSIEFYSSLGFEIIDNRADDNWVIMQCDNFKIGLFGAMLDKHTISLHTDEFDELTEKLVAKSIINKNDVVSNGENKYAMFLDPDKLGILIEKHDPNYKPSNK